jgi:DNA-binding response OmpR family regulator
VSSIRAETHKYLRMKVLLIEDDLTLSNNISRALSAENLNTECVYDGAMAERMLKNHQFDCVIMDINLPHKNGFELCKEFREHNTTTPVIMLTAFGELEDKVKGFECGADDYLTKPFFMRELALRVNSLIKRQLHHSSTLEDTAILLADGISLNNHQKKVFRQGKEINLTPREYQILLLLMQKKGEIVSKNELISRIWGRVFDVNTNTIEVYVNFLRNKLDKPFSKQTIKTKVGFGYYLDVK